MPEYIEREAALESVREKLLITEALPPGIPKDASTFTLASMQHSLESIPAADVRPVVKAHWADHRTIEHDGEWYCTACGKEITIYMGADRKDRYKFCPNCGAMMEANDEKA